MFEVEPNLWLQAFASPALTQLMLAVTALGYEWFYILLVVVLAFGVRLRPTLGVLLALLLAGLATQAAKPGFQLPRPTDVDPRVLHDAAASGALVEHGGASGLFALPSPEALEAIRAQPAPDYGFISGHVAGASALCLAVLLCFRIRHRGLWLALGAWPLLMALSRMYLGRHFLGDVLGGLLAGIAAACAASALLSAPPRRAFAVLAALALGLCALAPFTALLDQPTLGRLAGLVVVLGVLDRRGFPDDHASPWRRIARIACLAATYVVVKHATDALGGAAGWSHGALAWLPLTAAATAAMFLCGVVVAERLRLFGAERMRG